VRAIRFDEPGGPDVLYVGTVEDPVAGAGEVLVRVEATALNRADLLQRQGRYPVPEGVTPIPGLEMAGTVETVGDGVGGFAPGDRVFALLQGGGYAERVVVPSGHLMHVPARLSTAQAAAVPEAFMTAYQALFRLAGARKGDTVLVHAGASGVGTSAIQLAVARGITVLVTCSADKRRRCEELGAARAIDYRSERFVDAVADATGGRGVRAVIDVIGAPYFEDNLATLGEDGVLVVLATMGGSRVDSLDLRTLFRRRLSVVASTLRTRPAEYRSELTADFVRDVMPLLASGEVVPVIDTVLPWTDVARAHRHMEANRNVGKIVLLVD
jgi:putative PIG3 family NAD(P)H quinone oxidoreductase